MIPHIPEQDFRTGTTVAVRLMMVQRDLIHGAHIIQLMADSRQFRPADPDGAKIPHEAFPLNSVGLEAFLKN